MFVEYLLEDIAIERHMFVPIAKKALPSAKKALPLEMEG